MTLVTGSYVRPDGSIPTGWVSFRLVPATVDSASNQRTPGAVMATVDDAGSISIDLVPDSDLVVDGQAQYVVDEQVENLSRRWYLYVEDGIPVDLPSRYPGDIFAPGAVLPIPGQDGPEGQPGVQGDPGVGVLFKGEIQSVGDLPAGAEVNDTWLVLDTDDLHSWTDSGWLNIGPAGLPGPQGDDGADSIVPGPQGDDGLQGVPGVPGDDGLQGVPGVPGDDGLQGVQGVPGEVEEAPQDTVQYARKDAAWTPVASGGSLTLDELTDVTAPTPIAGDALVSRAGEWVNEPQSGSGFTDHAIDASAHHIRFTPAEAVSATAGSYDPLGSADSAEIAAKSYADGEITTHVVDASAHHVKYTDTEAQDALSGHTGSTANPHAVTKAQVGLGSADNTTDLGKPISTATQSALDGKSATTHNHDADYDVLGDAAAAQTAAETYADGLIWQGSQTAYDGLTPDAGVLYVITS